MAGESISLAGGDSAPFVLLVLLAASLAGVNLVLLLR